MSFLFLGIAASLAWFAAIDALMSLAVAMAASRVLRGRSDGSPALSPAGLLTLRLAPFATAAVVVLVWVAPAYWTFEPPHAGERIGLSLAALAGFAFIMLAWSLWRVAAAAIRTARIGRMWAARAHPVSGRSYSVPLYGVSGTEAFVALLGIVHPRLFIAQRVRDALNSDELSVVVAHELAHRRRFDNVARLAFRGCRDVLGLLPAGRRLERGWNAAAEQSADVRAADGDRVRAMHLASALVKVARLMPRPLPSAAIWSSLHDAHQDALLPVRVRRLLATETPRPDSSLPALALSCAAIAAAVVSAPAAWPFVHEATELLVRILR